MNRLLNSACFAAIIALPAQAAQERISIRHDAPANAGWYARIVIENPTGSGVNTYKLDTIHGPVEVQYFTTINAPCNATLHDRPAPAEDCADTVVIRSVPDGVVPSHWRVNVLEDGSAEIFLFHWLGA